MWHNVRLVRYIPADVSEEHSASSLLSKQKTETVLPDPVTDIAVYCYIP
jgi:hypothetical protein